MLLSVLCHSGNQTPGFDWTKLWMKIHCKREKKKVFLHFRLKQPCCNLLAETRLFTSNTQDKKAPSISIKAPHEAAKLRNMPREQG